MQKLFSVAAMWLLVACHSNNQGPSQEMVDPITEISDEDSTAANVNNPDYARSVDSSQHMGWKTSNPFGLTNSTTNNILNKALLLDMELAFLESDLASLQEDQTFVEKHLRDDSSLGPYFNELTTEIKEKEDQIVRLRREYQQFGLHPRDKSPFSLRSGSDSISSRLLGLVYALTADDFEPREVAEYSFGWPRISPEGVAYFDYRSETAIGQVAYDPRPGRMSIWLKRLGNEPESLDELPGPLYSLDSDAGQASLVRMGQNTDPETLNQMTIEFYGVDIEPVVVSLQTNGRQKMVLANQDLTATYTQAQDQLQVLLASAKNYPNLSPALRQNLESFFPEIVDDLEGTLHTIEQQISMNQRLKESLTQVIHLPDRNLQ